MTPLADHPAVPDRDDVNRGLPRVKPDTLVAFVLVHAVALLAVMPALFTWTGVAAFAAGHFVFGTLGINIGFHRLLAHRSFACPVWVERMLALFGTCSLQFSPAYWVAVHRRHHQFSDEPDDPHSPRRGLLWAHFGWLIARRPLDLKPTVLTWRYAKDMMRQPFYERLERKNVWAAVGLSVWILLYVAGFTAEALAGGTWMECGWFGSSLVVWGGALRTVVVWHSTWSVNSVAHVWGYRTHDTGDDSRNNPFVALIASGEGWHNNHHADPVSPRHGMQWWEIDVSWLVIRLMMALGLARPR